MISRFLRDINNQEHAERLLRKQPKRECEAPHGLELNQLGMSFQTWVGRMVNV